MTPNQTETKRERFERLKTVMEIYTHLKADSIRALDFFMQFDQYHGYGKEIKIENERLHRYLFKIEWVESEIEKLELEYIA